MFKDFSKILVISLIATILPMTVSFCFPGAMNQVLAETDTTIFSDPCLNDHNQAPQPSNDLLPCCVDGQHNAVVSLAQTPGVEKFIFNYSFLVPYLSEPLAPVFVCNISIIPPPQLVALKTTILRL